MTSLSLCQAAATALLKGLNARPKKKARKGKKDGEKDDEKKASDPGTAGS